MLRLLYRFVLQNPDFLSFRYPRLCAQAFCEEDFKPLLDISTETALGFLKDTIGVSLSCI